MTGHSRFGRSGMLASTALSLVMLAAPQVAADTTQVIDVELTRRSDIRRISSVDAVVAETPGLFGVANDASALGIDASFGNDRVTLLNGGTVSGSVEEERLFSLLPDPVLLPSLGDVLTLFIEPLTPRAEAVGIEGGFGRNTLNVQGPLTVSAEALATQADFDINSAGGLNDILPGADPTLQASATAISIGLRSRLGSTTGINTGDLTTTANAEAYRTDIEFSAVGIDLQSAIMQAFAEATGFAGDRRSDRFTNAANATIIARASGKAQTLGFSITGAQILDASDATQTLVQATGMDGGDGRDTLINDGMIDVGAAAELFELDVALNVREYSPPSLDPGSQDDTSFARANAIGMAGGAGGDRLTTTGTITLSAQSNYDQIGIVLSDGGISGDAIVTAFQLDVKKDVADLTEGAVALAIGVMGDSGAGTRSGGDTIVIGGDISATALAEMDVTNLSIGLPVSDFFEGRLPSPGVTSPVGKQLVETFLSGFGIGAMDYSSDAAAAAYGARGNGGNDILINSGEIDLGATALANTVGVSVELFDAIPTQGETAGEFFSVNSTVMNASTNALAQGVGLSGDDNDDQITNDGVITVDGMARATSTEVAMRTTLEDKTLAISVPVIYSQTASVADIVGLDGGDGYDDIVNNGSIVATTLAESNTTDVSLGVSILNNAGTISGVFADKTTTSVAQSTGIRDGEGSDSVLNAGTISSTATAQNNAATVGTNVALNSSAGVSIIGSLVKGSQLATARALGIERQLSGDPLDADASFTSTGDIETTATATSGRISVRSELAYTNVGAAISAPLVFSENMALAEAGALISFEADDVFAGLSDMTATAIATATTTGVNAAAGINSIGVGAAVSVMDVSNTANARARLLQFGSGEDTITNLNALTADADADSDAVTVSVSVGGTMTGVAASGAVLQAETRADAIALGIGTGADGDSVVNGFLIAGGNGEGNTALIDADAFADADLTGVNVSLAAVVGTPASPGIGVGIGAALTFAGIQGVADATGVDLGAGADTLVNHSEIKATGFGKAKTETVDVAVGGAMVGLGVAGVLSDTSVTASGIATGVQGGAGGDMLRNPGLINVNAEGEANTVGVSVTGSAAIGIAAGGTGLLTDTISFADARGMDGGAGQDNILSTGTIDVTALSDAANASIGVNITISPGIAVGGTYISTRTVADSFALGVAGDVEGLIDPDAGDGDRDEDDTIEIAGTIDVSAEADASAISVSANGAFGGGIGVSGSFLNTDTQASARSVGGFGGSGFDSLTLIEGASINSTATSAFNGPQIGVTLVGANMGDLNSAGMAEASGFDGGSGNDSIFNAGTITANATTTGSGELIQFNVVGLGLGDMSTAAMANAFGLTGGYGDDRLENVGTIAATSTATLTGAGVNVTLLGAALSGTGASAATQAYGLFGDLGADTLITASTSNLTSTATSSVTGSSVAVSFIGASDADFGSTATATSAGAAGGDGANAFDLGGDITATSSANARATNVGVTLAGAAFSQSDTDATATATGYLGGVHTDTGVMNGTTDTTATATARNDAGTGSIAGGSISSTSPVATANAYSFAGAGGADSVVHGGTGSAAAIANTTSGAYAVSLLGASSAKADPTANANAIGLDGGAGVDSLTNTGTLNVNAAADANVNRIAVTVVGASIGSASANTNARAAGLNGGEDGDTLINEGTINADAQSDIDSDGVDVTAIGAGVDTGDGAIVGDAYATGIIGGGGADTLNNSGRIISDATSRSDDSQVTVVVAGAGLANAGTTVSATASGLDGDDGADTIENTGRIESDALADAEGTTTSVTIAGVAGGDASAETIANSYIIRGGVGDDRIVNSASVKARATARGRALNVGVGVFGALTGSVNGISTANTSGILGGDGGDSITNTSLIDLDAIASGRLGRITLSIAGSDGGASAETDIQAFSTGLSGGDGEDSLSNDGGAIDIDLSATTSAASGSSVAIGSSNIKAGLFSAATGIGVDGGAERDFLENINGGDINVFSVARITAVSVSMNFVGSSASDGLLRSRATAIGMDGGSGNDMLFNTSRIIVNSDAFATASGSNFTLTGSAAGGGDVKSFASVTGLSGGAGLDEIGSSGALAARSDARATFSSGSYSLAGFSGSGGAAGADARAVGLDGGSGNDLMTFSGNGSIIADARATVNSGVRVTFGAANANRSPVGATATSFGLGGFGDNDTITNNGNFTVSSYAQVTTSNTKFALVGSASGATSAGATTLTYGLSGSSGNDSLFNTANLTVRAEGRATGSGAAGTSIGSTSSASEFRSTSNALLMSGGSGVDSFFNIGTLTGEVTNSTRANNVVNSSALFSTGRARSTSRNFGNGTLFLDTSGNTVIANEGTATLKYFGNRGNFRGLARTDARSEGVAAGVGVSADARSYSHSSADLRGVNLGSGTHEITNSGTISVLNNAASSAAATGNGRAAISGFGYAEARAYVNSTRVYGVESTGGKLTLLNQGSIIANNSPSAATSAIGRAVGIGLTDPDADSRSYVYLNDNRAYGVSTGDADDVIMNAAGADITVTSAPRADRALSQSVPNGGASLSTDADARAYAYANDAEAYGITGGNGDNQIFNAGTITARSNPYAEARAVATGRGPDGDVEARSGAYAYRAQAYGIITGSGDDFIENTGTISAISTPTANATNSVSPGRFCFAVCFNGEIDANSSPQATSRTIVGVRTGDGNDTFVSAGRLNAAGGRAIDLGSGNDRLIIAPGSNISGSITAGSGTDTLEFQTASTFSATNMSFENFEKTDASLTTLTNFNFRFIGVSLAFVDDLLGATTVTNGVLRTERSFFLSNNSRVTTHIYADGALGQLASPSRVYLDGRLTVLAGEGAYTDGATYDVVRGTRRTGTFDRVTLPSATALRSFSGSHIAQGYRVKVDVAPIASTLSAPSATQRSFAAALDGATGSAKGEVATTLGVLQSLDNDSDIDAIVSSMTPDMPTASLKLASGTMSASVAPVKLRLTQFRAGLAGAPRQDAIGFEYAQSIPSQQGATYWGAQFAPGNVAPALASGLSAETIGAVSGVDFMSETGVLIGAAVARLDGNGQLAQAPDGGAFTSVSASVYASTPIGNTGYATAALSTGHTQFDGNRSVQGFTGVSSAQVQQNSLATRLDLEAGRAFTSGPNYAEVYGGLTYQRIDGGAFDEQASSGLSLDVSHGRSERLESRIGIRVSSDLEVRRDVRFMPILDVSWLRRHGSRADTVTASFADMPGYEFMLTGEADNRNAMAASVGLSLAKGARYRLSATSRGEIGGAGGVAAGEIRMTVSF